MSYRKRPFSNDTAPSRLSTPTKRYKKYYSPTSGNVLFESQDIWRNLERIKKSRSNSDMIIKNSTLIIEVPNTNSIEGTVEFLLKYVSPKKLHQLNVGKKSYIVLEKFTLLDCCLVLPVILSMKDKIWLQPYNNDFIQILKDIHISGTIFVPKNCHWSKDDKVKESLLSSTHFTVHECKISKISSFREFAIRSDNGVSLSFFINGLIDFISSLKFGKSSKGLKKQFEVATRGYQSNINLHIMETSLIGSLLFDFSRVRAQNEPLLKASNDAIAKYSRALASGDLTRKDIIQANQVSVTSNKQETTTSRWTNSKVTNNENKIYPTQAQPHSLLEKPRFLTQDEIKHHCIATIKASIDAVKKMPSDTIFKAYIKCPRQIYAEKIQQNLDNIRSKTNCNVVILHVNNIHESEKWLRSLNVKKYVSINDPPAATIKVVSIGGIGEYISKALEMINKILSS